MHTVALLALPGTPLRELYIQIASHQHTMSCKFANSWASSRFQAAGQQHSLIHVHAVFMLTQYAARCHRQMYISPIFFLHSVWGQTAKFKDRLAVRY